MCSAAAGGRSRRRRRRAHLRTGSSSMTRPTATGQGARGRFQHRGLEQQLHGRADCRPRRCGCGWRRRWRGCGRCSPAGAGDWLRHGVAADAAGRGVRELRRAGLLGRGAWRGLEAYLASRADLGHVELRQGLAHELSFLGDDSVDLVILNSVVQYFPDVDYLLEVLAEAVRVTRRGRPHLCGGRAQPAVAGGVSHARCSCTEARGGDCRWASCGSGLRRRSGTRRSWCSTRRCSRSWGGAGPKVGRVEIGAEGGGV